MWWRFQALLKSHEQSILFLDKKKCYEIGVANFNSKNLSIWKEEADDDDKGEKEEEEELRSEDVVDIYRANVAH